MTNSISFSSYKAVSPIKQTIYLQITPTFHWKLLLAPFYRRESWSLKKSMWSPKTSVSKNTAKQRWHFSAVNYISRAFIFTDYSQSPMSNFILIFLKEPPKIYNPQGPINLGFVPRKETITQIFLSQIQSFLKI